MCAVFSDLRYVAVAPGVIREDMVSGSQKVGNLTVGEEFLALEEDGNRVKMERYAMIRCRLLRRACFSAQQIDFEDSCLARVPAPAVCARSTVVSGPCECPRLCSCSRVLYTERALDACCVAGAG